MRKYGRSWYGQKLSERMEIRIEPALKEVLDDIAQEKYKTKLSDFVRSILIIEAEKHHPNPRRKK